MLPVVNSLVEQGGQAHWIAWAVADHMHYPDGCLAATPTIGRKDWGVTHNPQLFLFLLSVSSLYIFVSLFRYETFYAAVHSQDHAWLAY